MVMVKKGVMEEGDFQFWLIPDMVRVGVEGDWSNIVFFNQPFITTAALRVMIFETG